MTRIFLDATTLISLGSIGELDLLTNFSGSLVVFPVVQDEVTTEPARTNLDRFIVQHDIETTDGLAADHIAQARSVLGEPTENGDVYLIAAVLGYTAADQPVAIVSDDRRVRTTAQGLGGTVTGTIGVIVRAVDEGLPPEEGYTLVDRIDSRGLHLTGSLREKAYSLIDEAADTASSE